MPGAHEHLVCDRGCATHPAPDLDYAPFELAALPEGVEVGVQPLWLEARNRLRIDERRRDALDLGLREPAETALDRLVHRGIVMLAFGSGVAQNRRPDSRLARC